MTREAFEKLVENYDSQDEILVSKMALLIEQYPYFQLPRFFYTKSLKDQKKNDLYLALNQLALYTADRVLLKENIDSKFKSLKKIEGLTSDVEQPIEYSKTTNKSAIEKKSIDTKKVDQKVNSKVDETQKKDALKADENISQAPSKKTKAKKSVLISKDLKMNFLDWIQFTKEEKITDLIESEKEEPLIAKLNIIDRFIESDPKIPPVEKNEIIDPVAKQNFNPEELMTESLAKVLVKQKKYKKAIRAYKILILKYPEKNVFFAGQIKKIKELQQR
tara:strand:- start:1060 stop:1887 length:828 start_codon:yes stop_codon:yes gene_type:complete